MSGILALVVGVVIGYGLALIRQQAREFGSDSCANSCSVVRYYRKRSHHDNAILAHLYAEKEQLSRRLVLQAACDKTRQEVDRG